MSAMPARNEAFEITERKDNISGATIEASKHLLMAIKCIEDENVVAIEHVRKAIKLLEVMPTMTCSSDDCTVVRKPTAGCLVPWQVNRITMHVSENIGTQISIDDLARLVNLSPSYFSAVFKTTFGISPHNYVLQQRIEFAKKRMLFSDNSFSEIALACGLSDQAHLSRTFRRITGMTPSAWRRFTLREQDSGHARIDISGSGIEATRYFNHFSGSSVTAM